MSQSRFRLAPANHLRRAFSNQERVMTVSRRLATVGLGLLCSVPVWAMSLSTVVPAPPPGMTAGTGNTAELVTVETAAAGSTTLVPLMAADMPARSVGIGTADAPAKGAAPVGKPIDDIQFVKQATQSGRKEIHAAQEALPQLKNPDLRHVAEMLVNDHGGANQRLSALAEAKGWPVPGPDAPEAAPPAGTAIGDFDAKFTAEMIAGHERSVALYRAQATGGEDKDLRKYAKETLPTIEKHLAELRRLQK
jgi:putative membrane protein